MGQLLILLSTVAFGGYGDAVDGYPSLDERRMHLWTNAARFAPDAFEDDYVSGGCSFDGFESGEQTAKGPLRWVETLNVAARGHSTDMVERGFFDHTNPDGDGPSERAAAAGYSGGVGENIAYGYGGGYNTVMVGWMCSSGHRANIMTGSYTDLGPGEDSDYFTQNFGSVGSPKRINMGVHTTTSEGYAFRADYYSAAGDAPDSMQVIVNGVPYEMELDSVTVDAYDGEEVFVGEEAQGIYVAKLSDSELGDPDCLTYFFRATYVSTEDGEFRFPEDGSYTIGSCENDDDESAWMDMQFGIAGEDDLTSDELLEDLQLVGCASIGGAASLPAALLGLLAVARRRW